ncbi:hypothetical protein GlitD10_1534 [Gloeomargarita lithophora Alchichica-D10]|uniref:Glycosyl transferase family 11 n=1 Tax=Gloeomargarita lithophora Alchichica-D10 TaxID=1188229 RepID=A0A1J0AD60_9CYAN|nr:alpha-1,2-fucosyltransferase [Gloeomargarita lithophora]APB33857.1 hypothetical protein GlitD10_1534 [Gloeomargarita lithophora Alchichica-D10]
MLISTSRFGQLCNRLALLSHLVAYGQETGRPVVDLAFGQYAQHFTGTMINPYLVRFPAKKDLLSYLPLPWKYGRKWLNRWQAPPPGWQIIAGHEPIDNACVMLEDTVFPETKVILIQGWYVRASQSMKKHEPIVREYFTPLPTYQANIDNLMQPLREKYDILVGLHIRAGDYRLLLNGVYIYSLENWRLLMAKMVNLLPDQNVAFLICSDENYRSQTDFFAGFSVYFGTGHLIEDLYSLAQCDYLLGAPSTYSLWASFYGRVPLYELPKNQEMPDRTAQLTLDQFRAFTNT